MKEGSGAICGEEDPHSGDGKRDPVGVSMFSSVPVAPPCTSAAPGAALSPRKCQQESHRARPMSRLTGSAPSPVYLHVTPRA